MICLIRHGETDWNRLGKLQGKTDIPLNATGIKQAEACGLHLSSSNWDLIVSSPLKRAKQTADIINKRLKLPIRYIEALQERSFGEAEGLTPQERERYFPDGNYPGKEDWNAFQARVIKEIESLQHNYSEKKVLLVVHGAVINMILSTFSKGEIGSGKTRLMNGCFNYIHFSNGDWNIESYNQVDHLI
jgi:uncharacterized phosphatase